MQTLNKISLHLCCLLLAGTLSLTVQAQNEKNGYTIEGDVRGLKATPSMMYLIHDVGDPRPTDSAAVVNGKYRFQSSTEQPALVKISPVYSENDPNSPRYMISGPDIVTVYPNKGDKMKIVSTDNMNHSVVTGSQADKDYHTANKKMEMWGDTLRKTYQMAIETNNEALKATIMTEKNIAKVGALMKEGYIGFVRANPASAINLVLIKKLAELPQEAGSMETIQALYQSLPLATRSSSEGKDVGTLLAGELKIALGHKAIDFTQNDTEGHPVSLSSFKGKYVLLLFWSSWERKAADMLPVLTKAYETYGSKGLVSMGVSLDADKDAWLQTIQEKNAGGVTQVSDLKGRANAVAQLYGITKLPKNLLIDPNGIIIARDIDQYSMNKTLTSIFE